MVCFFLEAASLAPPVHVPTSQLIGGPVSRREARPFSQKMMEVAGQGREVTWHWEEVRDFCGDGEQ